MLTVANDSVSSAERLQALVSKPKEPKSRWKQDEEDAQPQPQPVLPYSCYLEITKKVRIEKMLDRYFLLWHPFPKIFGELLVLKVRKFDQTKGKETMVYRDYSLCKRLKLSADREKSLNKKPLKGFPGRGMNLIEPEVDKIPQLQSFDINIIEPLSKEEWINFVKVIDATKGLGFFQLLPLGQKSSMPFQFNMLHVLPQDKWPPEGLPIDLFIKNQLTQMKRNEE